MKRTICDHMNPPYSLHDMNIVSFEVTDNDMIMKTQSGMVETYGCNMTKYCGYLLSNRQHCECVIEIYHEGDMVFVTVE